MGMLNRFLCGPALLVALVTPGPRGTAPAADGERPPAPTVPPSRGGQDLVGTKMPALDFDRWVRPAGEAPKTAGAVTLYRWWTRGCPFCRTSLPAVESLRKKYGGRGLVTVGVYHPKPPRPVDDRMVLDTAAALGYAGPVALDEDWSELKRLYLSTGRRGATSASFLVDRNGVIRFVHPGPDFFPSADPDHARQAEDYRLLDQAIEAVLLESEAAGAARREE